MSRLFWFGMTGTAAALAHLGVVLALVEGAGQAPLGANVGGFLVGFAVSYGGQRYLTFADTAQAHARTLPRFFAVACLGFLLNEGFYALLLAGTALPYLLALAVVLVAVAAVTFTLSRYWVF